MILDLNFFCKRSLAAILFILTVGIVIYSNSFQVPFFLDDYKEITNNNFIKNIGNFFENSTGTKLTNPNRVVGYLTFALNYHFGGLDVFGYHVVNLLIHLITALLVYAVLRLTFNTPLFKSGSENLNSSPGLNPDSTFFSAYSAPQNFIPLFAALLFVAHPIQTQAVTYIVQRLTSLATLLYILAVLLYIQGRIYKENVSPAPFTGFSFQEILCRKKSIGIFLLFLSGSVLSAVLAMKTKEIAFTAPLAIVLYELFFFQGKWKRRLLYLLPILTTLPIVPAGVVDYGSVFESVFGSLEQGVSGSHISATGVPPVYEEQLRANTVMPREIYLFTQFRVIVTYLRLLILPIHQNLDYDYPFLETFFTPQVFFPFLVVLFLFFLAVYLFFLSGGLKTSATDQEPAVGGVPLWPKLFGAKPQLPSSGTYLLLRLISFGVLWFLLSLSVESSFIPISDLIMEHRLYLPGFGAFTAFGAFFYLVAKEIKVVGRFFLFIAVVLVLVLGYATYQRNYVWGDKIRLWQDVVAKSPNKGRPNYNLGYWLARRGRIPEAMQSFAKSITVSPGYYRSYYALADLYLYQGKPEKSLPLLETYVQLRPDSTKGYVLLAAALIREGQFRNAMNFLEKNLDHIAGNAEGRFYLGSAYAFLGQNEAALRELEIVSRLDATLAASLAGLIQGRSNHAFP